MAAALCLIDHVAGWRTNARYKEFLHCTDGLQATQLGPSQIVLLLLIVIASLQPITKAAKSEPFGTIFLTASVFHFRHRIAHT